MINEDYVSFETAKLLKEKGFESDECIAIYDLGDDNAFIRDSGIFDNGPEDYLEYQWGEEWRRFGYYLAPTLQMAMKWLREVHHLVIQIELIDFLEHGEVWLYSIIERKTIKRLTGKDEDFTEHSYEEAAEAAIKYCLENLI
jgi:hypothetical protein